MHGVKAIRAAGIAGLVALAVGCVPCLHPVCGEADAVFDAGLLGVWKAEGTGQETVTFLDAGNRRYRAVYIEGNGEHGIFDVQLTRIGRASFLDVSAARDDVGGSGYYKLHLLPAHTFMKVVVATNGTMQLSPPAAKWLGGLLEDEPEALAHERLEDDLIVITASTARLRKFLEEYQATEAAFERPTRWRREAAERAP
jgi:hypothetical protein